MRDQISEITLAPSLAQAARTNATHKGTGVSMAGAHSATALFRTGTVTDGSHVIKLQHSDTDVDGNYVDVPAGEYVGTPGPIVTGNNGLAYKIGYIGVKNYVRPVIVTTGASTGGVIGADILLGHLRKA